FTCWKASPTPDLRAPIPLRPRIPWTLDCFRMLRSGGPGTALLKMHSASVLRAVGASLWKCSMWSERIYEALPVALQNAAVSVRGAQLHAVRYGSASFRDT